MARRKVSDQERQELANTGAARERFLQRKAWFEQEMARQAANRYQMALDEDYYDSIQWTPDEAAEVRERGQNPIVYNETKPTIDWLIGTERRMRRDFKVLARTNKSKEAGADAEVKTQLLKYLADVNRAPFERSRAADDAWKAGMGWLEAGIRNDPEDEPIFIQAESWRNMLHDSLAQKPDLSDSRYLFRFKEIDLDVAIAYFPDKEDLLRRSATEHVGGMFEGDEGWANGWPLVGPVAGDMPAKYLQYDPGAWVDNPRKRVAIIECWSLEPTRETTGLAKGASQDRVRMRMRVSLMTKLDTIAEDWSPYRHNRYPFIPVWAYRRKRDGLPYGPIRPIRGPQDDLNKRMSKSQFMLSVNQLEIEKSAIDRSEGGMGIDDLREESAAPDAVLVYADGALSGNRVRRTTHVDISQGHLALADRNIVAIRSASGVTGENRGMETSAGQSGKAIIAKQDQGSMVTAELFDNLLFAHQMEGEISLSLIEQFYNEPKVFSVTGDRFKLDYHEINAVDPVTGQRVNDVTRFKAQFVIGEAPWRQSLAEAAFESTMNVLGSLAPMAPQVVIAIIDLVFEWSDLPNKQVILQRIRSVTGMSDPDEGETPEQQEEKRKKAMLANAQFESELEMLRLTVREARAKGSKLDAEAISKKLEALLKAAQAAQVLTSAPQIAPVADTLTASVGFEDEGGDPVLAAPGTPPALPAPPVAPQAQPEPAAMPATEGVMP